ncbi:AraC-type DNA-binding protein [Flexibacter flexilis DSM 6793]|uniref:AraC-type DNA-binding protein n=1 Tax=Flexibacter flexilis DSM 6793 TaxID=927664 RepID=A0A1I1NIE8_9BACT|nr:AraC family transcriptional regulator [Flexibacter flexilis]SFC97042.1 AraC-type DNA-binding protein [Flexibacter flexilis DSM 6793]
MKIYIKNMVCPRCITAVEQTFGALQITPLNVRLGEVVLAKPLAEEEKLMLKNQLQTQGFELLDDAKSQQIEQIKALVIEHIHQKEDQKFAIADTVSQALGKEYSQLSKLFSETEGLTIEQYVIRQKIEKVKELLVYNQLNLSEIAFKLGYSSVAHLSAQFKKVTGLTPSEFRQQGIGLRKSLDQV